jgi:hypothetical protein
VLRTTAGSGTPPLRRCRPAHTPPVAGRNQVSSLTNALRSRLRACCVLAADCLLHSGGPLDRVNVVPAMERDELYAAWAALAATA